MRIENKMDGSKAEKTLDQTILDWYDREQHDEEKTRLRKIIADRVLQDYLETQQKNTGAETTVKSETLTTLIDSLKLIEELQKTSLDDEKTLDPKIEAVLILSGPGLFLDEKKPADQYGDTTYRWLNRDRILAGLAYARRVAAVKKNAERGGSTVQAHDLTDEDLEKYAPIVFYNGTAEENAELESVLKNLGKDGWDQSFTEEHPNVKHFPYPQHLPYPRSKIKIAEKPNAHTKAQMENLKGEVLEGGKLEGIQNISIAATILDFVRVANYIQKVFNESGQTAPKDLKFWAYPIRARRESTTDTKKTDTVPKYLLGELERLAHYLQQGHLASKPCEFQNVTNS